MLQIWKSTVHRAVTHFLSDLTEVYICKYLILNPVHWNIISYYACHTDANFCFFNTLILNWRIVSFLMMFAKVYYYCLLHTYSQFSHFLHVNLNTGSYLTSRVNYWQNTSSFCGHNKKLSQQNHFKQDAGGKRKKRRGH